jgi:AcrR family transcriptional regulator
MVMPPATRLSAEAWVDAAYTRFREEGLGGVRVEAIARDLATTKGSFYWHFTDRRALVDAVMARWEYEETDRFIAEADAADGPCERLGVLFSAIGQRRIPGEDSLYLDAEREGVQALVADVTERRVGYVTAALAELGIPSGEARRRALISVAAVLGLEQLVRGGAGASLTDRDGMSRAFLELMLRP